MGAFLILSGLMVGVFCALDGLLFYVFFEATLIPMYIIIGVWGGPRRVYAAFKFFLYTLLGSLLMLVALVYLYYKSGGSFDILAWHDLPLSMSTQTLLFFAFFAAFSVKVPMWPVHTWLPDAHVEAPTGGSVVLAAIIGGAGIEDHFDDGRFHDLFLRLTGPVASQLQLVFLATFRWLGGTVPEAQLDALFPGHDDVPGSVPATVLHNAPGSYRPITDHDRAPARRRARDARRRQPVRHRPADDRAHRARRPARGPRPAVRAGQAEQQGLRRRAAVPPRRAARRRRPHPRAPGDAPREGVRARSRGGPDRDLQPRRVEPQALLRDRRPRPLERARRALRRALRRAGGSSVDRRAGPPPERASASAAAVFAAISPLL